VRVTAETALFRFLRALFAGKACFRVLACDLKRTFAHEETEHPRVTVTDLKIVSCSRPRKRALPPRGVMLSYPFAEGAQVRRGGPASMLVRSAMHQRTEPL
jgi:hypothetical protein